MNKLTSLATLLLTLALAACATAPTQPAAPEVPATSRPQPTVAVQPQATTAPQAATHSVFFARPAGNHGPAQAYDTLTGAQLFTLPDGLFSADGQYYFALQAAQGQTTLDSYSPVDGHLVQTTQLDGEWELSFVTANGHYVTLARQAPNKQQTEVLILEGRTGHERSRVSLEGNFEVDSLAPDGSALFLIEYLPSINPDHYQIRLFDVPAKALTPGALVDKRFPDEVMAGERWDSVSTPNGQWQLTLYLRMQKDEAFIHALSTNNRFTFCIDLPSEGSLSQQKFNTLAISPSGNVVYVANAVAGTVAEVNMNELNVTHVTRFTVPGTSPAEPQAQLARSVLSTDGLKLYFTSGQNVWAYDTVKQAVTGPFKTEGQISGLGLTGDNAKLLVAKMDGTLAALDTSSGIAVSLR